ncbi:MAG TPA: DUF3124 domain-containing protein [Allocoleopsis sp.]
MKLKHYLGLVGAIAGLSLTACTSPTVSKQSPSPNPKSTLSAVSLDQTKVVMGQTLYVPIYSHIYHFNSQDRVMNLSATLSIRNTDLTNSIIITSVRYYDTEGKLIRQDLTHPVELKPLASTDFFVAANDTTGGSGANFIVEWVAEKTVYEPVVEAVMINSSSAQGISFISPARVLKQFGRQN